MKQNKNRIIRNYVAANGESPFLNWLDNLKDPITRLRIRRRLDRLQLGNFGDYKSVGGGVLEMRLTFGNGYRIYFAEKYDVVIILLCAGNKATQNNDIKLAKHYLADLEERTS